MPKIVAIVSIMLAVAVRAAAQAPIEPKVFYVPSKGEVSAFFRLAEYLSGYDKDPNKVADAVQLDQVVFHTGKYDAFAKLSGTGFPAINEERKRGRLFQTIRF